MPWVIIVTFSVGLEHRGGIEIRIETEREKMPVGRSVGCGKELFGRFLEITGKTWTILRDGTATEEKRNREGLAMKVVEADGLAEFVGEFAVEEFGTARRRPRGGFRHRFVFRSECRECHNNARQGRSPDKRAAASLRFSH